MRLLKDRFSHQFILFLCKCLNLNHKKRATLYELIESNFITVSNENNNKTVKIELADLLALDRGLNQENIYESGNHQKL